MKIGLMLGYSGKEISINIDDMKRAESLGFDSVWTAEAYGSDAVSTAAWILAQTDTLKVGTCIMQMPARSPAMAAMTAMTLDQLSKGRFIVGLGASGPQVVEGWHAVPYGKPVTRAKEYIRIMKAIFEREGPVEFSGDMYQMPVSGPGTTGLGKPLKSILKASPNIPIYTASITPNGLAAAGEVADGVFPIFMSPERPDAIIDHVQKGLDKSGRTLSNFDIAPTVPCVMDDNVQGCRDLVKPFLALYIGGMGAKGKNFYTSYVTRMGFGAEAEEIQDLYLAGKKEEATAKVPNELVDEIALIGPADRIKERAQAWKKAADKNHVGTLLFNVQQPELLPILAEAFL
jgi:F420-dependent oxidoreductase-like protein